MPTAPKVIPFQIKATDEMEKVIEQYMTAVLLNAPTGSGKTFMLGDLISRLYKKNFFSRFPVTINKVLYVTKANVVVQTVRALKEFYGLNASSEHMGFDVFVTNYDQLRATLGELIIRDYTVIERGDAVIKYEWKENMTPILVIWDECHSLMNEGSQQSQIGQAINDLPEERLKNVIQVFASATWAGRVSEAKCFSVATRIPYKYGFISSPLTNKHWMDFATDIAGSDYREFSPSCCKELMRRLSPYVVTVKNVRGKFHAKNVIKGINFETPQEKYIYDMAFEEYQEVLRNQRGYELEGFAAVLVAILKFLQAAELLKKRHFARLAYHAVQEGFAAIVAVNYRATIAAVVEILVNDYKVDRELISLIWGGIEDAKNLREEFQDLDLGSQSRKQRQREIDKFQTGKSLYCLFTGKAGGVGLSLHHEREDCRPRKSILTLTYNAKQYVQVAGRAHRITSLSDTLQEVLYYLGTQEQEVAEKLEIKMKCIKAFISAREDLTSVLIKSAGEATGTEVDSWIQALENQQREEQKRAPESDDNMFLEDEEDENDEEL